MEDSIAILLSTYNGEKYLEEQIDSIVKQDYKNWSLYIRDDGSLDSTVEIIQRYAQQYSNIYFVESNENLGAALSFLHLLHITDSKYYMFCDQDDIWLNNKISSSFQLLKKNLSINTPPILIFCDAKITDKDLNVIDNSFWSYNKTPPSLLLYKPEFISCFNCAPGCTMLFNKELKRFLYDYDEKVIMHDWYIIIKAMQNGIIKYVDKPLLLYRQHHNNVLGAQKISYLNRFLQIFDILKVINTQIKVFKFVNKYVGTTIIKFYLLKLKFNYMRFKKQ